MTTFEVNDMTCGHCVSAIGKAVRAVDAAAEIAFDLASKQVRIDSANADTRKLQMAIAEAGYTPVPVSAGLSAPVRGSGGCCCIPR